MNKIAIVDADGLMALYLEKDPNHKKAKNILSKLKTNSYDIIFPSTVIPEAITSMVRAANQPEKARLINKQFKTGKFRVIYIGEDILLSASDIFETSKSKQNTFFDAIVAATAKKLGADTIFSFDNWYPKLGLKLGA